MKRKFQTVFDNEVSNNIFWTFLGNGTSRFLMFIGGIICANIITKSEFGEFSFIRNTTYLVLAICGTNFSSICTKYIAEDCNKNKETVYKNLLLVLYFSIFISCLFIIILYIIPNSLLLKFCGSKTIAIYIKIFALFLPIFLVYPLLEGIFRGKELFRSIAIIQFISSIFFVFFISLGAYLFSIDGALIGLLLQLLLLSIISAFYFYYNFKKKHIKIPKNVFSEKHSIKKYILPVFFTSFIEAPIFWFTQLMVIHWSSMNSLAEVNIIAQIRQLLLIIPSYLLISYMPQMSRLIGEKKFRLYNKNLKNNILIILFFSIICISPFLFFPKFFITFYGEEYSIASSSLVIGMLSMPIIVIANFLNQDLLLKGFVNVNLQISIIWNFILLIITFSFLRYLNLGTKGFYLAQFSGCFALLILRIHYFIKYFNKVRK